MSTRMLAGTALAAGALALPAVAGARPAEQFDSGNPLAAPAVHETYAAEPLVVEHTSHTGTDTLVVLALAGGTFLVGAAGGLAGGRVVTRRHPVRP